MQAASHPTRLVDRAIVMADSAMEKQVDPLESMQKLVEQHWRVQSDLDEASQQTNDHQLASYMKRLAQSRRQFANHLRTKITSLDPAPRPAPTTVAPNAQPPRLVQILRAIQSQHRDLLHSYRQAVRQSEDLTHELLLMQYEELAEDDAQLNQLCAKTLG